MGRTLIKTEAPGWYLDIADSDKKVRKSEGDVVYNTLEEAQSANGATSKPKAKKSTTKAKGKSTKKTGDKSELKTTVSETGKVLVGKTITIKCKWRGCKATRTIKPQDKFQVKYCVEHQHENRKALRRAKQRARAAQKRKEQAAAKKAGGKSSKAAA